MVGCVESADGVVLVVDGVAAAAVIAAAAPGANCCWNCYCG